jgi:peroxiredoxin
VIGRALLAAALLAAAAQASDPKGATADASLKLVGKQAPKFSLPVDGMTSVSLRTLLEQKRPIVLSFFAWHCVPCEEGLPALGRVVDKVGQGKVTVLLIHVGEDKDGAMDKLLERTGAARFQHVIDGARAHAAKFGADRTIPRTVVIDKKGVVRKVFLEEGEGFEEQLEAALRASSS